MANTNKLTKYEMVEHILDTYGANDDIVEQYCVNEMILLAKKNGGDGKMTANQKANAELKNKIYDAMESGKAYTISAMTTELPCCAGFTSQKISALVKQMVAEGLVTRTEEKRVAYFTKTNGTDA